MHNTNRSQIILASAFILLLAAPACLSDLMCYVCDDCAQLNKDTPLLACNEDFFNNGGSTEASTDTTTSDTTILTTEEATTLDTETTVVSSSDEPMTTDPVTPELTTTEQSTESTESTEAPAPTPPTAGPPETTESFPTPPAEDLLRQVNITRLVSTDISGKPMSVASQNATASGLLIRQRRAVIDTEISYHCYTVQKTINHTVSTERGCSRVNTTQSVCGLLQQQNNDTKLSNCDPCSMNACNGASAALQASLLATLLFAVVAVVLQGN